MRAATEEPAYEFEAAVDDDFRQDLKDKHAPAPQVLEVRGPVLLQAIRWWSWDLGQVISSRTP
jgi:hypothetical protein